jgi:hypothetical protein
MTKGAPRPDALPARSKADQAHAPSPAASRSSSLKRSRSASRSGEIGDGSPGRSMTRREMPLVCDGTTLSLRPPRATAPAPETNALPARSTERRMVPAQPLCARLLYASPLRRRFITASSRRPPAGRNWRARGRTARKPRPSPPPSSAAPRARRPGRSRSGRAISTRGDPWPPRSTRTRSTAAVRARGCERRPLRRSRRDQMINLKVRMRASPQAVFGPDPVPWPLCPAEQLRRPHCARRLTLHNTSQARRPAS